MDPSRHSFGRRALNSPQETFLIAGIGISFQYGVQVKADHRLDQRIGRISPLALISPGAQTGDGSQGWIARSDVSDELASIAFVNAVWEERKVLVEFLAYQLGGFEAFLKTCVFYHTGDGWESVATVFQLPIKGSPLFSKDIVPFHEPLQQFFPVWQPTAHRYPSAEGQNEPFRPVGFL